MSPQSVFGGAYSFCPVCLFVHLWLKALTLPITFELFCIGLSYLCLPCYKTFPTLPKLST